MIKTAARHTVTDIELVRPTLEEVFLTYYGSGVMTVDRATRRRRPPIALARRRPRAALRAVVRRGLRDHRRAPLTWGGPLGAMSALMAAMWPSIEGSMDTLMESYPEKLKEAFNIRAITSVEAYIDAEMLSLIVPLALAFLAVRVVVRMLSGRRGARLPRHRADRARRTPHAGRRRDGRRRDRRRRACSRS